MDFNVSMNLLLKKSKQQITSLVRKVPSEKLFKQLDAGILFSFIINPTD